MQVVDFTEYLLFFTPPVGGHGAENTKNCAKDAKFY